MEFFNSLNLKQIKGGTKLKQGDLGSVLSYSLTDENGQEITSFDNKTAYINLVLDDKIWFTTTTLVDISRVTFRIDKAIPIGLYYLEIKIDDYIFPSDRDSIILIEEGSTPYDLKELVPNYDVNMTLKGILSDLSQKGIDISDLNRRIGNVNAELTAQLAEKANKDEVTNVMTPKGTLAYASLPTSGNQVGWYYYCPDGDGVHGAGNYVWNGKSWYFGGTGDEGYNLLKEDITNLNGVDFSKSPFNNGYLNKVNISFEIGNIDSSGNDADSDIRVRTKFFTADSDIYLTIPSLQYRLFSYSLDGIFESATDYTLGGATKRLSSSKKYKMVFANADWTLPNISELKENLIGFYGSLEGYISSVVSIPYANVNNALQYGFKNMGASSQPNDDILTDYLTNHGDEPLYFPKGRYIFTNPVTISNGCKFYLDPDAVIEYNQYGGNIGDFVTIENPDNNLRFIKGGKIECNSLANVGIRILNAHYFTLEDISINTPRLYGISTKGTDGKSPAKSCKFNNIRIKKADVSSSVDTYGIYDVGYDSTFKEICTIDFKFGMLIGGGAKVIDCHPWQSTLESYTGSCAYMVEHSTVEFENCVIDTFQRGIKVRGSDNITVTANNLRVFNNSDVVNSGEMTIFQGTNMGSTYCYPILHVSNISINDWGGNTKLIDFELPSEIKIQYSVSGVTQRANILNDSFTLEKRLSSLEKA